MIGYTLKQILTLVPEALPFVKQASIEQEYPLSTKSDCAASALRINYELYIEKKAVDSDMLEKVADAVTAYGIEDEIGKLTNLLRTRKPIEKTAAEVQTQVLYEKQASFECSLNDYRGIPDIEALRKQAEVISDECRSSGIESNDAVKLYSGDMYMSKSAAYDALQARFHLTQDPVFVKIASALSKEESVLKPSPMVRSLCRVVTGLDKKAGLHAMGFNFYKEALIKESAAFDTMTVMLCGKPVPLQSILRVSPHHLNNYMGKDFNTELHSDPSIAKAMIEALPLDMQNVLLTIVKNA